MFDDQGRSRFQALQSALKAAPKTIDYVAFDLLELDGEDLTSLPLVERKKKLMIRQLHVEVNEASRPLLQQQSVQEALAELQSLISSIRALGA